jgi:hypothetical protein
MEASNEFAAPRAHAARHFCRQRAGWYRISLRRCRDDGNHTNRAGNLGNVGQDMNEVTRRGTNWRNLQINGQARSIEFSDGSHQCVAVLRPGPVWLGGYTYMMHARICRMDNANVRAEDVAYVLGSLETRTYDPVGNLRKAGDPIYGPAGNSR